MSKEGELSMWSDAMAENARLRRSVDALQVAIESKDAEIERLMRDALTEAEAYRALFAKLQAAEAEVERLREDLSIEIGLHEEMTARWEAAESALLRVRALADAFADDGLVRHGGNVAWHIEEAIANEKGDFDAADRRIASQRARAEAAEAKVARVEAARQASVERMATTQAVWNLAYLHDDLRAAIADACQCVDRNRARGQCGACGHPTHGERETCGTALADAPAEQRAEVCARDVGDPPDVCRCLLPRGHSGLHSCKHTEGDA
jgi:hypothetical protein